MSEYFIGLDIGTQSVGWAVTDAEYKILKKKGKALWGVRLFPEAQKAEERRGFRTARRRLERRNQRIAWLRQIFEREIARVDPAFFQRVDESKYLEQDKKAAENGMPLGKYTLFADKHYCDVDYHREFPTIYHLRKALMTQERTFDVRLVYLALHHILKRRGHFLFGDMEMKDVSFENCMEELRECLQNRYDLHLDIADTEPFKKVLVDRTLSVSKKTAEFKKAAGISREEKQLAAILELLAGARVRISEACGIELSREDDISFSFKGDYENAEPQLRELLGDDMPLVDLLKKLYDWSLLEELKKGEEYISFAKVRVYEQHEKDLQRLKALFRADPKLFREMFRTAGDKLDNYPAYSGHRSANYRCAYDKFCTYAKKQIKTLLPRLNVPGQNEAKAILEEMEAGIFLPKQTNKDNGVIPHQLHEQELRLILERASAYLPFLLETDESGLSYKDKILEVFRFRIPYYVGPLNAKSDRSWLARTDEKITPWNFERVVDLHASAENFITNMTATCKYTGAPVLPKDSLLYSAFSVLNVINKIQINGQPISVDVKQKIFVQHALDKGNITARSIKNFMVSNGLMLPNDTFGGLDENFKAALTGWQIFKQILTRGNTFLMVEDIIRHIVLYGEDRRLMHSWLVKEHGSELSSEDMDYILRNRGRFGGWGSLSREFLTQIEHIDGETGEIMSIIDALWNTNCNLMELLSGQFAFAQSIDSWREKQYGGKQRTLDEVLQDSYASPGIRRAIHQTMSLISEIEKIMGREPKRVFVEVTRSEGIKERTVSRKRQLNELYASCKEEASEVYDQLQSCDDAQLRSAKLYLYFTQLGKCMYSGEPIDLSRPGDYDIDHIYPQSRVKDDSLSNRVLVRKQLNAEKTDSYPLPDDVRMRMQPFWSLLKRKKLISEEKYHRLTRNTSFDEHELSGFIARQLVETSQSCKIVAELLKNRYADSDRVVYVKAGNVASFRQDQRILPDGTQVQAAACKGVQTKQDPLFVKCRDVNDFHHAKDAYLNIVVGNVYHVKFTRNPKNFIKGQTYSLNRMFDFDVVRGGECAWRSGKDGTIATVRRTMAKNNILFTRYAHEATGGFYKQTIQKAKKGEAPIKSGDQRMTIDKFGGYTERKGAYFALVEHTEKKKRMRSVEPVYLMNKALYESDPVEYCIKEHGLSDPKVLIPRIKIDSLVEYDGFRMHISSRTGVQIGYKNANQLVIAPEQMQYIKQVSKYLERCKAAREDVKITSFDGISAEENCDMYRLLLDKLRTARYIVKYETASETLRENGEKFRELSAADQCRVLMQILNLFKTDASGADLKLLCGKAGIGILRTSKNLNGFSGHRFKLIHQSVTGFFEQEIDLLGDQF